MDAARLNFSHGTHDEHAERARLVREAQERAGRPLALIADLQGPKLRVGELESPLVLVEGDELDVTGEAAASPATLPISPPVLTEVLGPGHDLLIDDGRVRLRVEEVNGGRARATVLVGGPVEAHKGVNLPGVPIPIPSLTEKDLQRSRVRARARRRLRRALVRALGRRPPRACASSSTQRDSTALVIAKIEKAEALDRARRDRQRLGRRHGRARRPRRRDRPGRGAARAEADHPLRARARKAGDHRDPDARVDAAPPGADPRRGERRRQRDPRRHVRRSCSPGRPRSASTRSRASSTWTRSHGRSSRASPTGTSSRRPPTSRSRRSGEAMSNAACDIAEVLGAAAILVPTYSGRTASAVARHRPRRPVIAVTHKRHAVQQLALEWGVVPARDRGVPRRRGPLGAHARGRP